MKHPSKLVFGLLLWTAAAATGESSQKPVSSPGILFYSGSRAERLMKGGDLEAYLQLAQPKAGLRVRSLAWTGDEIGSRFRPEGYAEHLKTLLAKRPGRHPGGTPAGRGRHRLASRRDDRCGPAGPSHFQRRRVSPVPV